MSLHHAAQHLASKGRNGDTTLVHMTKGEVAGLQALARRNGTSLTINPQTGLPEAFKLKSLLPMAGGAALMMIPGMQPLGAAALMGGGTFLATGSLQKGLMAGLGAYGGAGLGQMAGIGAAPAGTQAMAGQVGEAAVAPEVVEAVATPVETIQAGGSAMPATQQYAGAYQPTSFSAAPSDLATEMSAYSATPTNYSAFGDAPAPLDYGTSVADATQQNAAASYGNQTISQTPKPTFMDNVMANKMQAAQYGIAAASPLMQKDPYTPPELKSDADMGQRYAFDSGYSNDIPGRTGPAAYRQISNEEARKLYGFAEGGDVQYPAGESVIRMAGGGIATPNGGGSAGGGVLANLLEKLKAQGVFSGGPQSGDTGTGYTYDAQTKQYTPNMAEGGDVASYVAGQQFGPGIDYSGYDTAPNAGIAAVAPAAARRAIAPTVSTDNLVYDPVTKAYYSSAMGVPANRVIYDPTRNTYVDSSSLAPTIDGYSRPAGMTIGEALASDAITYGKAFGGVLPGGMVANMLGNAYIDSRLSDAALNGGYTGMYTGDAFGGSGNTMSEAQTQASIAGTGGGPLSGEAWGGGSDYSSSTVSDGGGSSGAFGGGFGSGTSDSSPGGTSDSSGDGTGGEAKGGLAPHFKRKYATGGGISTLGGYSDGGRLLKGPGDGMSDNIPAQIGAKQPARLADGEFVVPADVVSHLGNGSTDAGAKQLYKMMDKIRQARTGRKAQGKQINPKKFLPA